MLLALALAAAAPQAAPAPAQTPTAPTPGAPTPGAPTPGAKPAPVDPARLAAARAAAVKLWPVGTYKRMMGGAMTSMMDSIIQSSLGMKASDMIGPMAGPDGEKAIRDGVGDATIGEMAKTADPHFAERMKIMTSVMFDAMGDLMTTFEPEVQDAVAHGLARRFTVAELSEIDRFFETPVGARYAADAMLLAMEPEMVGAMTKFMPEFLKAMPDIMKKVEAATAHLPPPPTPKTDGDDEENSAPSEKKRT